MQHSVESNTGYQATSAQSPDAHEQAPHSTQASSGSTSGSTSGDNARAAADDLRQGVKEAADAVKEESGKLREDLGAAAADQAEALKRETGEAVEGQRFEAAESIGAVASALQAGVDALESEGQHAIAGYWRTAADGASQFADRVRDKPLGEAWHEAEDYVREQPAMGFGGAMLAGFMLARFLKSSAPDEPQGYGMDDTFGTSPDSRTADSRTPDPQTPDSRTIGFGDDAGRYSRDHPYA